MGLGGSTHAQIGTLIVATSVILLANGFFGTFVSLRVAVEGFEGAGAAVVLSSYFAGFTLGVRPHGSPHAHVPRAELDTSPRPAAS